VKLCSFMGVLALKISVHGMNVIKLKGLPGEKVLTSDTFKLYSILSIFNVIEIQFYLSLVWQNCLLLLYLIQNNHLTIAILMVSLIGQVRILLEMAQIQLFSIIYTWNCHYRSYFNICYNILNFIKHWSFS